MLIEPSEFTEPILFTHDEARHSNIPYQNETLNKLMKDIIFGIKRLSVIYYKPFSWSPSIRVEVLIYIANDEVKLGLLIHDYQIIYKVKSAG